MIVEFIAKKVYGTEYYYPVSNDAEALCKLIKRPTLTRDQLKICKGAGWVVKQKKNVQKETKIVL